MWAVAAEDVVVIVCPLLYHGVLAVSLSVDGCIAEVVAADVRGDLERLSMVDESWVKVS